jgi:hypothetical protein
MAEVKAVDRIGWANGEQRDEPIRLMTLGSIRPNGVRGLTAREFAPQRPLDALRPCGAAFEKYDNGPDRVRSECRGVLID